MQNKTAKKQKKSGSLAAGKKSNGVFSAQPNGDISLKKKDHTDKKSRNSAAEKKTKNTKQAPEIKNERHAPPSGKTERQKKSETVKRNDSQKRTALSLTGNKSGAKSTKQTSEKSVRIIFLGGINEIGKNLTVFEYNDEMVILDCGMTFPDADMPGIDYVLPDFTFIERNRQKIKAVFITHGHEDHIGGLPYLLKLANIPVYASRLTMGLIESKLREHRLFGTAKLNVISSGDVIKAGSFTFEAIHVNHSIPDSFAYAIRCPAGLIVHTGDFKIDNTPIDGESIELTKFAKLGDEGVLCMMQDSTNAEKAGYTPSEKNVGETLEQLFVRAGKKRVLVASFASNIHRIQQIIDASVKMNRKVFLSGRSLENVVTISKDLGYLNVPDGLLISIENLKHYSDEHVVLITTGSQGEPMSALARMATQDHRKVTIGSNDFVIISATPIPGNEKTVANTINDLMKLGAEVVYEKNLGIHVSGHAAQEELKLMMNILHPKFFIPVHGEQKHMRRHAELAESVGIPEKNTLVPELGSVIEVKNSSIRYLTTVPAGRIYVDGSGVGDVGSKILRDRRNLSTDGVVFVSAVSDAYSGALMAPIDIQSKGFIYANNAGELHALIEETCKREFSKFEKSANMDLISLKQHLSDAVSKVVYSKTRRNPVVIVSVFSI